MQIGGKSWVHHGAIVGLISILTILELYSHYPSCAPLLFGPRLLFPGLSFILS